MLFFEKRVLDACSSSGFYAIGLQTYGQIGDLDHGLEHNKLKVVIFTAFSHFHWMNVVQIGQCRKTRPQPVLFGVGYSEQAALTTRKLLVLLELSKTGVTAQSRLPDNPSAPSLLPWQRPGLWGVCYVEAIMTNTTEDTPAIVGIHHAQTYSEEEPIFLDNVGSPKAMVGQQCR